jgi:cobalt-precorrin 5A hydrolase/precorrin-3B C17-methyltransferase
MSIFSNYQPLHFIPVKAENMLKLSTLTQDSDSILWLPNTLKEPTYSAQYYDVSLAEHIASIWSQAQGIVFCLTVGAVVRLISPLLKDKQNDPCVIVISPNFDYVISLVGGHQGKGDKLTDLIAHCIQAQPIITSASFALNLPPIDTFGEIFGWNKSNGNWTQVSSNITRGKATLVRQTAGLNWWQKRLPDSHPFVFTEEIDSLGRKESSLLYIGVEKNIGIDPPQPPLVRGEKTLDTLVRGQIESRLPVVCWHPRVLWVGIGCERNTSSILIESALQQILNQYNLARESIASLVTIDIKRDEVGILQLAEKWDLPLQTYTAEELKDIAVPNPSTVVENEVGTPSVAEACAIKGASWTDFENNQGSLIVSKQIIKSEEEKGAVTIAIAQSSLEYNPHDGKLYLIGTGSGDIKYLTNTAQTALRDADIIIGYGLYIDLIQNLLRPEQIIESYAITQEQQRAERAIQLAQWGLKVAVISSGDCGIYGMAGLVLEILAKQNWDGKTPSVEVFSGITALQSLAAKVGSPLMHDFCAISLSDLLTPWEVIERRMVAAASADFVTAIYNPRSKTRQTQIVRLQEIFLEYRKPNTPVAIARSLGREDEQIILTTLEDMLNHPIDMLTTVMIGNSSTMRYKDLLITPRGYLTSNKL